MLSRLAVLLSLAAALWGARPVPVIFDTDVGNDIDDVLALAMLHALESRGECKLLGVTLTNPASSAGPFTHLLNRFYGRSGIPVGLSEAKRKSGADHKYLDATLKAAPGSMKGGGQSKGALQLLRELLTKSQEKVVIVQVGFSDNLAALLASPGGPALIREKVALLSVMAGDFATDKPEYNVRIDVPAARRILVDWPSPVVASGFEIGNALLYPAASIQRDFAYVPWHPVVEAYSAFEKMPYDRPTWDLTSVLYAVRPDAGYFDVSPPGTITVDDKGTTRFRPGPMGNRRHLILKPGNRARVLEALILLASQPPSLR